MTDGRRKARLEEMFTWEIATAMAEVPLCYLPVGTLEWHGEHAAVGLDALKAHAVCIRAADRSGGLVAPLYWSIAHNIAAIRETGEVFRREHPKSGWLLLSDQEVVPDLHNPVEHAAGVRLRFFWLYTRTIRAITTCSVHRVSVHVRVATSLRAWLPPSSASGVTEGSVRCARNR